MKPKDYKETREKIGTQTDVAGLLGVHRDTIAKRESGKGRLNYEAQLAIRALAKERSAKNRLKSSP